MMNVLVIAPHPDDELLGLGGTLLKHKSKRDKVACIYVTNIFKEYGFSQELVDKRQQEIEHVSDAVGFDEVYKLDYPTAKLDSRHTGEIISKFSKAINEFRPEVLYIPFKSDVHSDHRIIFEAAMSCTKSFRYSFIKKVLMYETISETEFAPALADSVFIPNYYVNISDQIEKKIELLDIYGSEMGEHPFPRSKKNILALATYRGAIINVQYAEAFQLLKCVED